MFLTNRAIQQQQNADARCNDRPTKAFPTVRIQKVVFSIIINIFMDTSLILILVLKSGRYDFHRHSLNINKTTTELFISTYYSLNVFPFERLYTRCRC